MGADQLNGWARSVGSAMMVKVDEVTTVPRATFALALVRIGVAIAQLSLYTTNYTERWFLYGPDGVYPRDAVRTLDGPNLFLAVGEGRAAFEVVYHLGMVTCIALALGLGGRLTIAAAWVLCWSMWNTNGLLIDGGDNLTMVLLPMLFLTRCQDRLSVRTSTAPALALRRLGGRWPSVLLSNAGAFGIMVQICLVYFTSGFYKANGQMWVDGTALYYIARTPEYFFPPLTPLLLGNDFLLVTGTYGAMILLIAFPFLVLTARIRPWAVAAMLTFHLGIALLMGLTSFALVMAAADTMFISGHVGRAFDRGRQWWWRWRARRAEAATSQGMRAVSPTARQQRDDRADVLL